MQTAPSGEQRLFREVVYRALRERSPTEAVRELMATEGGFDPAVWKELCGEVGLPVSSDRQRPARQHRHSSSAC